MEAAQVRPPRELFAARGVLETVYEDVDQCAQAVAGGRRRHGEILARSALIRLIVLAGFLPNS